MSLHNIDVVSVPTEDELETTLASFCGDFTEELLQIKAGNLSNFSMDAEIFPNVPTCLLEEEVNSLESSAKQGSGGDFALATEETTVFDDGLIQAEILVPVPQQEGAKEEPSTELVELFMVSAAESKPDCSTLPLMTPHPTDIPQPQSAAASKVSIHKSKSKIPRIDSSRTSLDKKLAFESSILSNSMSRSLVEQSTCDADGTNNEMSKSLYTEVDEQPEKPLKRSSVAVLSRNRDLSKSAISARREKVAPGSNRSMTGIMSRSLNVQSKRAAPASATSVLSARGTPRRKSFLSTSSVLSSKGGFTDFGSTVSLLTTERNMMARKPPVRSAVSVMSPKKPEFRSAMSVMTPRPMSRNSLHKRPEVKANEFGTPRKPDFRSNVSILSPAKNSPGKKPEFRSNASVISPKTMGAKSTVSIASKGTSAGTALRSTMALVSSIPPRQLTIGSNMSVVSSIMSRSHTTDDASSPRKSPRISSTRGCEAELKIAKKMYFDAKKDLDSSEANVVKIVGQIFAILERISHVSGKERALDDDLKEIRNFAALRMSRMNDKSGNPSIDLTAYQNSLAEIDKIWLDTLALVMDYPKDIIKWLESKKIRLPDSLKDPSAIELKVAQTTQVSTEKRTLFLSKIEFLIISSTKSQESSLEKVRNCENIMAEQEYCIMTHKKIADDLKEENEKIQMKQMEINTKHLADMTIKNKEVKDLKSEISTLQISVKTGAKIVAEKEKEHKDVLALLQKQVDEVSRREAEWKRKCLVASEKLNNIHMREASVKKLEDSCHHDQATRAAMVGELDKAKKERKDMEIQLTKARVALDRLQAEISVQREKAMVLEEELASTQLALSLADQERGDHDVGPSKELLDVLEKEKELALQKKKMERQLKAIKNWEKELTLREDRLFQQQGVAKTRDALLKLMEEREARRAHPSGVTYEAVCQLLQEKTAKIDELKKEMKNAKRKK